MIAEPNEQELIDAYKRVESFLADPAVKSAFARVKAKQFDAFSASNSVEEREGIFAQSKALDALAGELIGVMNTGQFVQAQRAQREQKEEQIRRMANRRNK